MLGWGVGWLSVLGWGCRMAECAGGGVGWLSVLGWGWRMAECAGVGVEDG